MFLRRFEGLSAAVSSRLRRGLSTAATSRPRWALLFYAPLVWSSAPRPSLQLLEPPCASHLLVPIHLVDPRPGSNADSDTTRRFRGGIVQAVSGDGLLLLAFMDIRDMDPVAADHALARASRFRVDLGPQDPDIMRFVCNPLSGEMFCLPDAGCTKKDLTMDSHGLITNSAREQGPPDRYAVAKFRVFPRREAQIYTIRRFLSQTGEWDELVGEFPSGLLLLDRAMMLDHAPLAFAGRLWWVDVSRGAISMDPFSDRPDFHFVGLPRGSVTDPGEVLRGLGGYRLMGVSEGRLCYAEVTREEPFVLSSFALDNDSGSWTLEHGMALSSLSLRGVYLWQDSQEDAPRIAAVDPLNANVMHITIDNAAFSIDMDKEEVIGCSAMSPAGDYDGRPLLYKYRTFVLPPWLESRQLPSAGTLSSGKANAKSNTLADVLVRVDRR